MMNKYLILTSFVIMLLAANSFAQSKWSPAYVLLPNGDTVYGFIDQRNSKSNAKQCHFKKEVNDKKTVYAPSELLGYKLKDGRYYVSKNLDDQQSDDYYFLEFIIQGEINVYHLKENASRYFVEKDAEIYELVNTSKFTTIDNQLYSMEKKEYLGILNMLLQEADIQDDINTSELNNFDLIKIAKKYHEIVCPEEPCIVYERKVLPVKMNIGIHAGLSYNSINFGNSTKSDYSPGSNMGMRLTLENAFTWEENISFSADFTLQWFSNYHLYKVREFSSQITYNDVEYDLVPEGSIYGVTSVDVNIETLSLKIPFCVNYHFSKARLRPKVGIGFINMLVISQNTDFVYHDFYYEFNRSIPVYHFGFRGKIGLDYQLKNEHSIYFDLNYDYTQSANINAILRFRNNLFAFNLGYTL